VVTASACGHGSAGALSRRERTRVPRRRRQVGHGPIAPAHERGASGQAWAQRWWPLRRCGCSATAHRHAAQAARLPGAAVTASPAPTTARETRPWQHRAGADPLQRRRGRHDGPSPSHARRPSPSHALLSIAFCMVKLSRKEERNNSYSLCTIKPFLLFL
jgi:hypothetical protein